ncbi:branched-chain amino acid ABC transporter, permease protein [Aeromicrobium marinum DSM 15272]|uniref:Autoinducer 2 import system permease protein LsrD n=1 Tax=Aeromicrobium marinum DSM 15272 TaxID=585531 RepID=E2SAS9_9ACTN|nr:ABC transporter permease [Aeromicrobium marinum]EFQ83475.1 branched-chain amino acid ABC transporter, permease protein [Aeromicrobium marinum DSM 15272]
MNQLTQSPVAAAPPAAAQVEPVGRSATGTALLWAAERGIVVFTAALILASVVFVDGFASAVNIADVFHRAAPIGIVAVGMTFVVISGNYLDLSVVAQVATSAVILIGVSNSVSIPVAIALAFAVSVAYGLVNGVAVGYFKANAVIVTLSTTFVGLGLLRWLSGGSIYFGPADGPIESFGDIKLGVVPVSAIVLVLVAIVLGFLLSRTNFGFAVRSFGSNKESTRLSGVNTPLVVVGAFMITAFAATIAGFVLAAYSNTAVSSMSDGYDFGALAAIIIGGTSVFGGRGSVLRTVLGVIFVSVLTNVLVLSGADFGWQQVAIGSLIVLAVSVDALARKVSRT